MGTLRKCHELSGRMAELGRSGAQVECHCTQLWGGQTMRYDAESGTRTLRHQYWVKTPCCQGGRRNVVSGDRVTCPECGWHFRADITPARTVWTSLGYGAELKNRFGVRRFR